MFEDILRILGVALVGFILIVPSGEYLDSLSDTTTQVMVGMVVIITIFFIDTIFGALLGLAVLIWFFKMNHRVLFIKSLTQKQNEKDNIIYGTKQNLADVQTNVVNDKMVNIEMIGFDGVHGEQVIGAQGLDKTMPGFDNSDVTFLAPL